MASIRARRHAPALLAAGLLLAGCLPEAVTREGRSISALYDFVLLLALAVTGLVWGLLTFAVLRYRRRRQQTEAGSLPAQTGGNVALEAVWTVVPLLTIFALFGLTLITLDDVDRRQPGEPVELHVEAFRWGWRMSYPAEQVTVDGFAEPGPQAVVPVGQPLLITLTSRDVVHAFYVPQFLYKRDAIPGRDEVFELTIEHEGTYRGQCAEFCGLFHARMPFSIRAVPAGEYEAWVAEQQAAGE
ncbi:MAG: cytochrome c oxidase subunit II [Chloroflexota bacterium]|nr:cytochrome c oxidase subunit II [Chloroflexota bacterium]